MTLLPFGPSFQLLVAQLPQLSGDGQLRELMQERRRHLSSASGGLWYVSPHVLMQLGLGGASLEAIVIADPEAVHWLQLRFGGTVRTVNLSEDRLSAEALALPPMPPVATS